MQKSKRDLSTVDGIKNPELELTLKLRIRKYTNNKEIKEFIVRPAQKLDKTFKVKSGAWYRLNRWREEQIGRGKAIAYGDLVKEFVRLCKT